MNSSSPPSVGALPLQNVGAVAIGRNEGERLRRCLTSLLIGLAPRVVYVDSGSTDGSVTLAEQLGVHVITLDTSAGFSAARARNAGWRKLLDQHANVDYIQFVDGDCEVFSNWLTIAKTALDNDDRLAIVCGRRREREPDQSPYNQLCDMEWNTPVGEAFACGGDNMVRVTALKHVQGYDDRMIAGEEPEMCIRLRQHDWRIERVDADMTWHDAAMSRFGQWWKRCERAGHAYAEWVDMHGRLPERPGVRESRSIFFWAIAWPLLLLTATLILGPYGALGGIAYPLMIARIAIRRRRQYRDAWSHCLLYGVSCVAAKWPQACGQIRFIINRRRGRRASLIEYKG